MKVTISNRQRRVRLDLRGLRRGAEGVLKRLGAPEESLSIALVGDRAMRALNRRFRDDDEPTDVLAFPSAPEGKDPDRFAEDAAHLGDVVVSVDQARLQSEEDGEPLDSAIERLLIHGILHLKGYDHSTARGAARMRKMEERLRRHLRAARRAAGAPRRAFSRRSRPALGGSSQRRG